MAENAPPAASAANAKDDSARGMPYYDKLRRDLRETMQKKRILEQNMVDCPFVHELIHGRQG